MKIDYIAKFYQILRNDNLSFVYQGYFSDVITEKIIALSEYSIDVSQEMVELRNKISFLIVECFQNIVRHGNDHPCKSCEIASPGLFSTRSEKECIYITFAKFSKTKGNTFETVVPFGESRRTGNPHLMDQMNLYSKQQTKAITLDKAKVLQTAVKVYHPK